MHHDSKTILITGCAGFIGSHLVDHCIQAGIHVIGVDNFSPEYDRAIKERNLAAHTDSAHGSLTLIEADVSEAATIEQITPHLQGKQVAAIIHLARPPARDDSRQEANIQFQVNVIATRKLLELAKTLGHPQVIFASTDTVYQQVIASQYSEDHKISLPTTNFALTKLLGEQIGCIHAEHFNAHVTALRFGTVYGPRLRPDCTLYNYLKQVAKEGSLLKSTATESLGYPRNFIYIDDLVQAIAKTLNRHKTGFEIINLAHPEQTCPHSFFKTMSHIFGVMDGDRRATGAAQPAASEYPTYPPLDLRKAKALLGFEATTDFQKGARILAEWFFEQYQES